MFQFDALETAIRNRIAPDLRNALENADSIALHSPRDSVSVPLQADVQVLHDKNLAAFAIRAHLPKRWSGEMLCYEAFFSTMQLREARDKAEMLTFLFNEVLQDMLHKLAEGELDEMLGIETRNSNINSKGGKRDD